MAVSVASTSPVYPTTQKPVLVTFALSGGGNFLRAWCTDAPLGSKLKTQLLQTSTSRVEVFSGTPADIWEFNADKGGAYVFKAQEYTRGGVTFGGGYAGDRRADGKATPDETKIGGEDSATIRIGQRLTMQIGSSQDRATLALWVWDTTIRATTYDLHGEATPAVLTPSTPRAANAAASSGVTVALAALDATAATTALGTLSTIVNEMIDDFNLHRVQGGVHSSNDTNNTIATAFKNPGNEAALKRSVGEIVTKLDRHMRNDNAGAGTGSASYHSSADHTNTLLFGPPGSMPDVIGALADIWRAYEAHRASGSTIHSMADSANTLTALPKLLEVHKAFLAMIQPIAPAAPATANAGVVTLVSGAGMSEG